MGGKFCFRSKVTDLIFENNTLKEIEINNDKRIPAQVCVLAPGHSARDTFEMLHELWLYLSRCGRLFHINELLYTEEERDLRASGVKQFDYVNPANREVQIEMERGRYGTPEGCWRPNRHIALS